MIRRVLVIASLATILMTSPSVALSCRTDIWPDTNNQGGAWLYPAGVTYPIVLTPPPGAVSVGLEFWMHQFPHDAPAGTMYLLWYLNDAQHGGRRMGIAWNGSPAEQGGAFVNFPLSTFLHSGEQFVVTIVNNSGADRWGYLAVTVRTCF